MTRIFTLLFLLLAFNGGFSQGTWSALTTGTNDRVESFTKDANYLYVGGRFTVAGGNTALHIARWNGSAWTILSQGVTSGTSINSMIFHNGDLFAAGSFTEIAGVPVKNVVRWNGISWSSVGSGLEYTGATTVSTLCVYNNELYAGGLFNNSAGTTVNYIAKWDGANWVPVAGGTNGPVHSLCVYNGELYAGGVFTDAGGVQVKNIARYNGAAWNTVDNGLDSYTGATTVSTLRVFMNNLYAGGQFQIAGADTVNNIAMWDGMAWSDVGGGLEYTGATTVSTLIPYNNNLYAGGTFTNASGTTVSNLAHWNGSSWSGVGGGTNGSVYAMEEFLGSLYVGGDFEFAGSVAANNVAKWDNSLNPLSSANVQHDHFVLAVNGADQQSSYLKVNKMFEGNSKISIYDVTGKTILSKEITLKDRAVISCPELETGVYFFRLITADGKVGSGKFILR